MVLGKIQLKLLTRQVKFLKERAEIIKKHIIKILLTIKGNILGNDRGEIFSKKLH